MQKMLKHKLCRYKYPDVRHLLQFSEFIHRKCELTALAFLVITRANSSVRNVLLPYVPNRTMEFFQQHNKYVNIVFCEHRDKNKKKVYIVASGEMLGFAMTTSILCRVTHMMHFIYSSKKVLDHMWTLFHTISAHLRYWGFPGSSVLFFEGWGVANSCFSLQLTLV